MKNDTPKEEAANTIFTVLNAEYHLSAINNHNSELHATGVVESTGAPLTSHEKKVIYQYCEMLQRAARPIADYLTNRGWDMGTSFPWDDKHIEKKEKAA